MIASGRADDAEDLIPKAEPAANGNCLTGKFELNKPILASLTVGTPDAADLDPLGLNRKPPEDDFVLKRYGLAHVDPETIFSTGDLAGPANESLRAIIARLKDTYSRTIGVEYTFLEKREARNWLRDSMELTGNHIDLSREQQIRILTKLTDAEIFEQFLHTKYTGAKRFSLEGGEALIPLLDRILNDSAQRGMREVVFGMSHRGRLNVLANTVGKSLSQIFAEFEGNDPSSYQGSGDVKYHREFRLDVSGVSVISGLAHDGQDKLKELWELIPVLLPGEPPRSGLGGVSCM